MPRHARWRTWPCECYTQRVETARPLLTMVRAIDLAAAPWRMGSDAATNEDRNRNGGGAEGLGQTAAEPIEEIRQFVGQGPGCGRGARH